MSSNPHLLFCAFKTAPLALELLVSMGRRLRLLICERKTACLDPEWRLYICASLQLWFDAFKKATLASEFLVSMGPAHICGFVHSQQRHYDQN